MPDQQRDRQSAASVYLNYASPSLPHDGTEPFRESDAFACLVMGLMVCVPWLTGLMSLILLYSVFQRTRNPKQMVVAVIGGFFASVNLIFWTWLALERLIAQ